MDNRKAENAACLLLAAWAAGHSAPADITAAINTITLGLRATRGERDAYEQAAGIMRRLADQVAEGARATVAPPADGERVVFVAIAAAGDQLFALDDAGRLWYEGWKDKTRLWKRATLPPRRSDANAES